MDCVSKVLSNYDVIMSSYKSSKSFPFVVLVVEYYKDDLNTVKQFLKWYLNNSIHVRPSNDIINAYFGNYSAEELSQNNKSCIIFSSNNSVFVVTGDNYNGDIILSFPPKTIDASLSYHTNLSAIVDNSYSITTNAKDKGLSLIDNANHIDTVLKKIKKHIIKNYYIFFTNNDSLTDLLAKKIYINKLSTDTEKISCIEFLFLNGVNITVARSCWIAINSKGVEQGEIKYWEDFYTVCNKAYDGIVVINIRGEKRVVNFTSETSLYHSGYVNKKNQNSNIELFRQLEKYIFHADRSARITYFVIISDGVNTFIIPENAKILLHDLLANHNFKIINYFKSEADFDGVFKYVRTNMVDSNLESILYNSKKTILDYPMFDKKWRKI